MLALPVVAFVFADGFAGTLPRGFDGFFATVGTVAESTGDCLRNTLGDGI